MVLADEIHEFSVDTQIEIWRAAIAKVAGSAMMFMGSNCPATAQLVGSSYANSAIAIAKGDVKDDTQFALVARVDKRDHDTVFENEACWVKPLPALGIDAQIERAEKQAKIDGDTATLEAEQPATGSRPSWSRRCRIHRYPRPTRASSSCSPRSTEPAGGRLPPSRRISMRLLPDWRQAWRWWSVRVSALGALLAAIALLAPDVVGAVWAALPPELLAKLPRNVAMAVPLGLELATIVARITRQRKSTDGD